MMNIEQIAIDAGVIIVTGEHTYWSENNAIEVLDKFAKLVIINNNKNFQKLSELAKSDVIKLMDKFDGDMIELDKNWNVLCQQRKLNRHEMIMLAPLINELAHETINLYNTYLNDVR